MEAFDWTTDCEPLTHHINSGVTELRNRDFIPRTVKHSRRWTQKVLSLYCPLGGARDLFSAEA